LHSKRATSLEAAAGLKGDEDLILSPIQSPFLPQEGEETWQRISAMRRPLGTTSVAAGAANLPKTQREEKRANRNRSVRQVVSVLPANIFWSSSSFRALAKSKQLISPRIVLAGLIFDLVPLPSCWGSKAKQRPLQLESSSLDQTLEKTVSKERQETRMGRERAASDLL
jgi:hypothetical protein